MTNIRYIVLNSKISDFQIKEAFLSVVFHNLNFCYAMISRIVLVVLFLTGCKVYVCCVWKLRHHYQSLCNTRNFPPSKHRVLKLRKTTLRSAF